MPEIFISYRRSDSIAYTGRLAEHLRNSFGAEHIFRDYEALGIGVRFKKELEDAVLSCSIMLVVIGPEWTDVDVKTGQRRLDDVDDFVRFEIELALAHDISVIPVLVEAAQMPIADILPDKIKKLTEFNAHSLSEKHWDADVVLLIKQLSSSTGLDVINQTNDQASSHWLTSLQPVLYAIPDFFTLLRHPKQFLRKRNFGRPKDLLAALIFFIVIVLIAEIYLSNTWRPEHYSFWESIYEGIFLWLLVTFLVSVPLWFAWWLLGAREHYQRILVILLYQMTVVILLTHIVSSIMVTGILFQNPNILDNGFKTIWLDRKNDDGVNKEIDMTDSLETVLETFENMTVGTPGLIAIGLGVAVLIPLPLWLIASWSAYRESLKRPRWTSAVVFSVFVFLIASPLMFLLSIGS